MIAVVIHIRNWFPETHMHMQGCRNRTKTDVLARSTASMTWIALLGLTDLRSITVWNIAQISAYILLGHDSQEDAALNILRSWRMSISVFESLLCFILRPRARSNGCWSLISNALSSKLITPHRDSNEVELLDVELLFLKSGRATNIKVHGLHNRTWGIGVKLSGNRGGFRMSFRVSVANESFSSQLSLPLDSFVICTRSQCKNIVRQSWIHI